MLLAALVLAIGGGALFAPSPAEAAITSCTVSTSGVIFSPYNTQTKAAVDGAGTITVTCTGTNATNAASVHLGGGNANSCTARQMRNGANNLGYQIYKDAARTAQFCTGGDRLQLANFNFTSGLPQTQVVNLFGRVTANQNPAYTASAYTDTLTASVLRGTSGTVAGSTSVPISGSVAPICSVSAGTLGFGSYSGSIVNATATVTVNCTNTAPYQVSLGGGSNQSGSTRRMAGPLSSYLGYELFRDSGRTLPWGDGSAQLGARQSGTGTGSAQSLTVYGRLPAGQMPAVGSYSDSVVVTVEY
jgi:spore coat protein U-like protein